MATTYNAFATTRHLQNGVKVYLKKEFGFEFENKEDSTDFETFEKCEEIALNSIPSNFVGRIFIEDDLSGDEYEIFNNI